MLLRDVRCLAVNTVIVVDVRFELDLAQPVGPLEQRVSNVARPLLLQGV